jgi:hypothetical protein
LCSTPPDAVCLELKLAFSTLPARATPTPDKMDAMGSFEAVVYAFSQQVAELREATLLRVDGACNQRPEVLYK